MNRDEAAAALNIKAKEVADVEDSPAGPVITTTDGVRYVIVPEDQPDANGKTGLMFLAAPNLTGDWPMPIYAQPGAVDTEPEPEAHDGHTIVVGEPTTEPTASPAEPEPTKGKGIRSKAD